MEAQGQVRDQWGTKIGFILAAIGSAIGLGNIWRYPYVVYENGGGAFLLPYFIAIITAGIPLLILEYSLGNRSRRAAPFAYRSLARRWEWLGWWQIGVSFLIASYYMVVIGWVLSYVYFSFGTQWGADTNAFFFEEYLAVGEFWAIGGIQWNVFFAVLLAWAINYWLLIRGVSRGIEIAARILIPALVVMIVIVTIRGLTLPGAAEGLNVLLTPDFSALLDPAVWVAAYGQVFFSIGVAFSIMIAYSSYLSRRADLSNSGFIVALSNSGFEFLAALGIFSVLGYLAIQQGVAVDEVATSGIGLAFVTFPQIINELPALQSLFGVLFFGALFFAGLTSSLSILECCISGVRDKFGLSRLASVNWVCVPAFLVSMLYVTNGGINYLDVVDRFMNNYGLVLSALFEVILVAWVARQLGPLQRYVNERSYLRLGRWWIILLSFVTPVAIAAVTFLNFLEEFSAPYGDYPVSGLLVFGAGSAIGVILLAFVFQAIKSRETEQVAEEGVGEADDGRTRNEEEGR
jgi:neurotransmitter:Na+ symporter, NSS family